jgi:hypothetical protein
VVSPLLNIQSLVPFRTQYRSFVHCRDFIGCLRRPVVHSGDAQWAFLLLTSFLDIRSFERSCVVLFTPKRVRRFEFLFRCFLCYLHAHRCLPYIGTTFL